MYESKAEALEEAEKHWAEFLREGWLPGGVLRLASEAGWAEGGATRVAHEKLLEHHAQMDAQQSEVAGYLDTEGATAGKAEQLGDCVTLPAAGPACGCYVAECAVYRSGGSNP